MEKSKSYIRYSTDAPIEFGEVMAIQKLGFALGPDVVNRIQPKALYHNSYSDFVGPSTLARKDTVQELLGETIIIGNTYAETGANANVTVTLPLAANFPGHKVIVQNRTNHTGANVVTINRSGSDTLGDDSSTSFVLSLDKQHSSFVSNGIDCWLMA